MGAVLGERRVAAVAERQGNGMDAPESTPETCGGTPMPVGAGDRHRGAPTTGMRGGLGRTLLTAFLILTILPLAIIGAYAVRQNRQNIEQEVGAKLLAIAALKGEALEDWLREVGSILATAPSVGDPNSGSAERSAHQVWWDTWAQRVQGLRGGALLDRSGRVLWTQGDCHTTALRALIHLPTGGQVETPDTEPAALEFLFLPPDETWPAAAVIAAARATDGRATDSRWVLCLQTETVVDKLQTDVGIGTTGDAWLVTDQRIWPSGELAALPPAMLGDARHALYKDQRGEGVVGGFYPLPALADGGILVQQSEAEVLASTERIIATLIALILGVALFTTAIAAVVIRQITRPVIDLTESAVAMAEGNLDQHLEVRSRDEIGILTYVFNEMAAELKSLYRDLESKVIERTKRLQQANYQIQRRALHLQASQEVSQAITSVRDPDLLLTRVTDLIRSHFIYSSVAVYLLAPGGGEARLQAFSPRDAASSGDHATASDVPDGEEAPGGLRPSTGAPDGLRYEGQAREPRLRGQARGKILGVWHTRCRAGDGSVVGRVIRKGETQLHNEPAEAAHGWHSRYQSRVAIPLKMADRMVGVVAVTTTAHEGIQHDELAVLEGLANQVTIALENARAYERERQAMEHMEAAEAFKSRFLGNMSRELRGPLNTVIGFSRLLIKGLDGPLNERQTEDLEQIYQDSQHLLVLINDLLSISQIQAGLMALSQQSVDLSQLVAGVMPTASALVRGKDIVVRQEIPDDLPALYVDPARIRQVLIHLLNNAAKFTEAGEIVVRAWENENEVYVSVSDTGIGIPVADRERIFSHFETARHQATPVARGDGGHGDDAGSNDLEGTHAGRGTSRAGIGLGLALCREYIELHGGVIWVDSEVGTGSTFTFSVPVYAAEYVHA